METWPKRRWRPFGGYPILPFHPRASASLHRARPQRIRPREGLLGFISTQPTSTRSRGQRNLMGWTKQGRASRRGDPRT